MKTLLLSVLAVVLTGCGTIIAEPVKATHHYETMSITWVVVDDVDDFCRKMGSKEPGYVTIMGCAMWNKPTKQCFIYTERNTTTTILGHELLHCFYEHFH